MNLDAVAVATPNHLREWTADELASESTTRLKIALEEIKDVERPTAKDDDTYLATTKAIRCELRKRKKTMPTIEESDTAGTADIFAHSETMHVLTLPAHTPCLPSSLPP